MSIVFLLTIDALRKDAVGCYCGKMGYTPFLNSIQEQCVRFTRPVSVGPYTQSAFPGILSSSYLLDFGYSRDKKLNSNRILISQSLKKAGVLTGAFPSNPYLCEYFGWNRGWDYFYDSMNEEVTDKKPFVEASFLNAKVKAWLETHSGIGKAMFVWIHYMDVHEPYVPERKYTDIIDAAIDQDEEMMFSLFKEVLLKRDVSDLERVKILKKLYCAGVRKVDDCIKEFFEMLRRGNLLEDSVIIITSDHGDEFGEHGGLSHDGKMYSELVDVPLMIFDHRLREGQVCEKVVSTLDIAPTVMQLFGLEPCTEFQGHSLLPPEAYPGKGVFSEAVEKSGHRETGSEKPIYMYREDNLKVIYSESTDRWEIYDLERDPAEKTNVVWSIPEAKRLMEILLRRVRRWEKMRET